MHKASITIILVLFVKIVLSQEFTLRTQYEEYFTNNISTLNNIEGFWIDDYNKTYSIKKIEPFTGIMRASLRRAWSDKNYFDSIMNSNSMLFYELVLIQDGVSMRNSLRVLTVLKGGDTYFVFDIPINYNKEQALGLLMRDDFLQIFDGGQFIFRKIYPLKMSSPSKSKDETESEVRVSEKKDDIESEIQVSEKKDFFSDFNFNKYKEVILAILTLSFIWAIYFATKKIHKKVKNRSDSEVPKVEEKNDFMDFNELLEEKANTNSEKVIEGKNIDSEIEKENPNETNKIVNPEILKVSRKIRFLHFTVDLLLAYAFSFLVGYLFGIYQLAHIVVDNQFLFGCIVIFVFYFSQEYFFGKTVGKFITKTHVVDKKGNKPSLILFVVRTISRLIPFDAITYLSKEKRGLHDIISTTYVIKD
jgi:uncharacterized RDD family membrane protein YckC